MAVSNAEPSIPPLIPTENGDPSKPVDFEGGGAVVRADGSMILPLDTYISADDESTIVRAENALAQKCMQAKGIELPKSLALNTGPQAPAPYVLYGLIDIDSAKIYGYREPHPIKSRNDSASPDAKVTPAVEQAYFGDPKRDDGCAGQARRKLGGQNARTLFTYVQELRSQSLAATNRDGRVTAVVSKWSACMRESGYDYPNPLAPGHDRSLLGRGLPVPPGATLPPPSPAEIAAAVTDIKCKRRTNYLQTAALVSAAYEQEIIAKHASELRDAQAKQRLKLQESKEILQGG
ncbi:hypothetical protein [Streptomyces sp. NPDC051994]|uniref:hypothetical protein n=1 Tax=unclassified Streptomyces TaxID=2593676 RepID=UPI003412B79C